MVGAWMVNCSRQCGSTDSKQQKICFMDYGVCNWRRPLLGCSSFFIWSHWSHLWYKRWRRNSVTDQHWNCVWKVQIVEEVLDGTNSTRVPSSSVSCTWFEDIGIFLEKRAWWSEDSKRGISSKILGIDPPTCIWCTCSLYRDTKV